MIYCNSTRKITQYLNIILVKIECQKEEIDLLSVFERKSRAITSLEEKEDGIYLRSDYATLRISLVEANVFRVSFSEDGLFGDETELGFLPLKHEKNWFVERNNGNIVFSTKDGKLEIKESNGTLRLYDVKETLLLSERDYESREKNLMLY